MTESHDAGEQPILMEPSLFLPGVPVEHVLDRVRDAGGNEIESGKLASPESSAALAINCFGWFIPRPELLPPLPGFEGAGTAQLVDVEFCARFPWSGGRHPWLDAVVQTATTLIGIESKRFEPFRDKKTVNLSEAYDRKVWGENMRGFEAMRDRLRSGDERFTYLDAAQLVKHAFGLVTVGRRRQLKPGLLYIYAEPTVRGDRIIPADDVQGHRQEVARFATEVAGDEVAFHACSYGEWLGAWNSHDTGLAQHRAALLARFRPTAE